ncbi:hypothetical protein K402DRAFT_275865 [Aulographum hederae CBS 113979]|uniref:CCHC-type domain-containing protein n=1 Tax=Aulographum hederae CBS 113979 TaxID=1176131 RepID=A0A6G1GI77_9PEZI|nr:hypothetical protein K402DRAFT_275865 [Aulographum hederae CBS 113979]
MVNERSNSMNLNRSTLGLSGFPGTSAQRPLGMMSAQQQQQNLLETQETLNDENSAPFDAATNDNVFDSSDEDEAPIETRKRQNRHARFGSPHRRPSRSPEKRMEKLNNKHRRFTFERDEAEFTVVEHVTSEEGNNYQDREVSRFTNAEEFNSAITQGGLEGIYKATIAGLNELKFANQQVEDLSKELEAVDEEKRVLSSSLLRWEQDLKTLTDQKDSQARDLDRVRVAKSTYRAELKQARARIEELEKLVEKYIPINDQSPPFDSSDDDAADSRRAIPRRTGTPASSRPETSNNKWPDIKEFYGDTGKQRDEYPQWKLSILSKFRNSYAMFTNEQAKIDYVRDKCKATAFSIVETRADLDGLNPYNTFDEMIQDLDSMFAEHDPKAKADNQMHSASFAMKKNERFDTFLARFTKNAAILQLSDDAKISTCKRLLNSQLKEKISDGTAYSSYSEFIRRCKQCDLDLTTIRNEKAEEDKRTGNTIGGTGRGQGRTTSSIRSTIPRIGGKQTTLTRPQPLIGKLMKIGACFKCGEKGHRHFYDNAPCKTSTTLSDDAISAKINFVDVAELPAEDGYGQSEN